MNHERTLNIHPARRFRGLSAQVHGSADRQGEEGFSSDVRAGAAVRAQVHLPVIDEIVMPPWSRDGSGAAVFLFVMHCGT